MSERLAGTQEGASCRGTAGRFTRDVVLLAALAGFGFALRLWGAGYGLPSVFHPDETRQVLDALSMGQRLSLLPLDHTYPALHKYLLVIVYGGYYLVGVLLGWFARPADFAVEYFSAPTAFFWLGRVLSVLMGTVLGLFLYFVGRRLYSPIAGWLAALFGMSMLHLAGHSQWVLPDIFLAFACTAAIYYMFQYVESPAVSRSVLASFWIGIAVSTKYHGLFLMLPLVLAHLWVVFQGRGRAAVARSVLWGGAVLLLASLAGNLAWVFQFRDIAQKFSELSEIGVLGISSKQPHTPGMISISFWFVKELVRQEILLGAFLIAGALYALYRHTARDIIALSFVAISLYALSGWGIRYLHLFVSTFPLLCLFAARLCDDLLSRVRCGRRGWAAVLGCLVLVSGSVARSVRADMAKSNADTREMAVDWVTAHLPAGSRIAVDWYELGPQFPSDIPVAASNPRAVDYWENHIDASIRQAYLQRIEGRKSYRLLSVLYATDTPNWPPEMPAEVIEKAVRYPAVKHLYSRFNFYSLQQLKQQGAQYLVISSFAYCNFLLDDDQRKTGLFDPYGAEDTLANNRQAASYHEQSFHGLLFYLAKRARDFYLPLLASSSEDEFELVYEVGPTGRNWGPVVRIFRLR
ncbi:MAG: glycosyltransferase family 39 protein [Acidobacteria bacterium]|nr:glycosyltransferase family 39 protein [Acidobacteriota bacterium]